MSTSPTGSEVHYPQPLQDFSVAKYSALESTADQVFPVKPVAKQFDLFREFDKDAWMRSYDTLRLDGDHAKKIGWKTSLRPYYCGTHAIGHDILDSDRQNADDDLNLEKSGTEIVTEVLVRGREKAFYDTVMRLGLWETERTGAEDGYWDTDSDDPAETFDRLNIAMGRKNGGLRGNTLILGEDVEVALKHHPLIKDAIKYTQRGIVTRELLAEFFGVERVFVQSAMEAVGPEGATPQYVSLANPKSALLLHVAKTAGKETRTAGVTFSWTERSGGAGIGARIKKYRDEARNVDVIEGEMAYGFEVIDPSCGVLLDNIVR